MTMSLHGRLLCAAVQSYEIVTAGAAPPCSHGVTPCPSDLVGWASDPLAFVGGPDGRDAVLVGETATELVVAFRGTEPVNIPDRRKALLDWANDLDGIPIKDLSLPGLVHQGFAAAADDLWAQAGPKVIAMTQASPGKALYLTGHSKGGALAPLAAMMAVSEGLKPHVVTFAGARCGDPAFAMAYAGAVPDSTRYEYRDDIVPHLPASERVVELLHAVSWFAPALATLVRGFVSVGRLQFIDWDGHIVDDTVALEVTRVARLAQQLLTGGLQTILNDHDLDPGGGYATTICPGVWPH